MHTVEHEYRGLRLLRVVVGDDSSGHFRTGGYRCDRRVVPGVVSITPEVRCRVRVLRRFETGGVRLSAGAPKALHLSHLVR